VQGTIQAWADEGRRAPGVLWLYGPAGAGKSAIAQTMAETWTAQHRLAAAFFFARWRTGGSSGKRLFPTIAYQLALHIPELRASIGLAVEADPAICDKALEEQARVLIVDPVGTLHIADDTRYLVILDGLDECEGKLVQGRIVNIISRMLADASLPIMFLLCSRPEPHIRETFDSLALTARLVLDGRFNPAQDILRYLRDSFAEIQRKRLRNSSTLTASWPSPWDLAQLVRSASGQFVYAATVIKFVDDEYSHPNEQLQRVLSLSGPDTETSAFADLDALYKFILSVNPNTPLLVRILGAYFALPKIRAGYGVRSVSFLDDILGLPCGTTRLALRGLHSLFLIPESDTLSISVHHASLQDFLCNPERASCFFLDVPRHQAELFRRCIKIVQDGLENPEESSHVV
jgi:hypothetical protein